MTLRRMTAALQLAVGGGQFFRALVQCFLQPVQVNIALPRGAMRFLNRNVGLGKKNSGESGQRIFPVGQFERGKRVLVNPRKLQSLQTERDGLASESQRRLQARLRALL